MAADLGMLCTCNARTSIIRWQLIWACSVHAMPGRVLKDGCRSGHALNMQCQDEYYKMAADLSMLCSLHAPYMQCQLQADTVTAGLVKT